MADWNAADSKHLLDLIGNVIKRAISLWILILKSQLDGFDEGFVDVRGWYLAVSHFNYKFYSSLWWLIVDLMQKYHYTIRSITFSNLSISFISSFSKDFRCFSSFSFRCSTDYSCLILARSSSLILKRSSMVLVCWSIVIFMFLFSM